MANWWGKLSSHYPKRKPQYERFKYIRFRM